MPHNDYAEVWKERYAELLGYGVPDERAKSLASELAAAAVLTWRGAARTSFRRPRTQRQRFRC